MTSALGRAGPPPGGVPGYALGVFRHPDGAAGAGSGGVASGEGAMGAGLPHDLGGHRGDHSPGEGGTGGGTHPVLRGVTGGLAPGGGTAFTGLLSDGRVRDVSGLGTVNDLLSDWDDAQRRLDELAAAKGDGDWADLAGLDVRCPVSPGQILQAGANYRKHVVDIVMAERRAGLSVTGHNSDVPEAEVRQWAEAMMDERARSGAPYVFAGLPSALAGPYDDIVLPERGASHDWELELAAVIGKPARNLTRENALSHVAGYTICNDLTTRDLVYRADLKAIGSDWLAAKNAPTFLPTGPFLVPAQPVSIGELRAEQVRANPEGHRYTVDNAYLAGPRDALVEAMTPAFTGLPTPKSFSLWFDLAHLPARPLDAAGLPDMALSLQSDIYFATYVVGESPAEDALCRSWVDDTMRRLEPFSAGCYLGDSDFTVRPGRFMSDTAWDHLGRVRADRDPGGLFPGYDCADPALLNASRATGP